MLVLLTAALWTERLVLLTLVALSIWSVGIMIERFRVFKPLRSAGEFEEAKKQVLTAKKPIDLRNWSQGRPTLLAQSLHALADPELKSTEALDRAFRSYLTEKRVEIEKGLGVLATLGANAPFIGLFGTVLGVLRAFGELAAQGAAQEGTRSVMAAISVALVATAIGLFVAIPAVIAYNSLGGRLRTLVSECESLRDLWIAHHSVRQD